MTHERWPEDASLAVRLDRFTSELGRDGNDTVLVNRAAGLNFSPVRSIRIQLDYIGKNTWNAYDPDLDDDILFLNFQFSFDSDIVGLDEPVPESRRQELSIEFVR